MRVLTKRTLKDFAKKYPDSEQQLIAWHREHIISDWTNLNEIVDAYSSSSMVGDNRVVFRIKGNKYRLVVKYNFEFNVCWIRFVGTHKDYDKINARII